MSIGSLLRKTIQPRGEAKVVWATPDKAPAGPAPRYDWQALVDSFLSKWVNSPERRANRPQGIFHPSAGLHPSVGNCRRQLVFELLYSPMSPTQIPPKLAKILDLGTERGAGLEKLFETMASNGFQGIVKAEKEAYCEHMALPLSGHADVILTMRDRHQYLFDFKTISPTDFAKTYEPKLKHRLQVNTYMGIREIRTGFLIYENKAGCEWAGPSGRFYVEFDKQLYKETEQFCVDMLKYPANQELPEFNSTECAGSITFCWYRTICERERNETISWLEVDRRPETVKKRHLEVIQ